MVTRVFAPEMAAISAMGQFLNAREVTRNLGHEKEWDLTQAFYIQMGGFVTDQRGGSGTAMTFDQIQVLTDAGYAQLFDISSEKKS